jgi:hypothetical protein
MEDPYNYPMPCRKDLMSLSTINGAKDLVKTKVSSITTMRLVSGNLDNNDIEGEDKN